MRRLLIPVALAAAIGSFVQSAGAVTIRDGNTPYPDPLVVADIATPALFKCNVSGTSCNPENDTLSSNYADNFTITLNDFNDEGKVTGGTFSFQDLGQEGVLYPRFFTLKAGNQFAIFELTASDYTGTSLFDIAFSTKAVALGTNQGQGQGPKFGRSLSNLAFYDSMTPLPGPNPIPLPASAWLLISALGGLGFLGRLKRLNSAA